MRNPGFGAWNRNDDPADGANPDWLTSQNIWDGPEDGGPVKDIMEPAEIKALRRICESLKRQDKLTFDNIVKAVINRQRNRQRRGRASADIADKITTKMVRQICNEYK